MIFEIISVGLSIITAVAITIAWIYKSGKGAGADAAEDKTIKAGLEKLKQEVKDHAAQDVTEHKGIYKKMDKLDSKIDKIQGSTDVIKDLVTNHLSDPKRQD